MDKATKGKVYFYIISVLVTIVLSVCGGSVGYIIRHVEYNSALIAGQNLKIDSVKAELLNRIIELDRCRLVNQKDIEFIKQNIVKIQNDINSLEDKIR